MRHWPFIAAGIFAGLTGIVHITSAEPPATQPKPVRENIEWLDVWVPDVNQTGLPRVLLIGDSITKAYGPVVEQKLKGKAFVARLTTSKSLGDPAYLEEVALILRTQNYDLIHFNNGMHGDGYTEDQYATAIPQLLALFHQYAPNAQLIWASTTPVRKKGNVETLDAKTDRVKERNRRFLEIISKEKIPVDDLFSLVLDHSEYSKPDGVHYNPTGVEAEATQVAAKILEQLK